MNYLSLKSATAEKIGKAQGNITYHVLCDEAQELLFVTITGNDLAGCYSDEIVPFAHIEKCVDGMKAGTYVPSKLFFKAFSSSKSNNNNCGFLAAILRAEELLAPVIDGVRKHVLQPGWDDWKMEMLTSNVKATPYIPPLPKGSVVAAKPTPKLTLKVGKKVVVVSEPIVEEVLDAESN